VLDRKIWAMAQVLLWCKHKGSRCDSTIMDAFSPELAQHWLAAQAEGEDERIGGARDDELSPAQQEALEELAERVSAARSVY
jgi:hypothetical protein